MVQLPTPKPMSGVELGARQFVIEGLVIELWKQLRTQGTQLPPDMMDRVRKTVLTFNRPELTAFTDAYIEEISAELATVDQGASR